MHWLLTNKQGIMLLQAILFALITIINSLPAQSAKVSIEDYLRSHGKLLTLNDDETLWDRSSVPADRDLTYPVENHPVPEVRVRFLEKKHLVDKKKSRSRERRQIPPGSCYLLFANRVHIIQMQNVPSLRINVALTGYTNAVAVDFDKRDDYLFWSDVAQQRIYRSRLDGREVTTMVATNITTPDGIAWDWVNKKLYWTDVGDQDLEVYDPSTGCRNVLIRTGSNSKPRAIVLDPSTGWMYWTDWGTPAKIERASMDGSNRTVLHGNDLWWPNALTIDYENQTLYWMDAIMDKLERSNTDGSGRTLLSTLHIQHPFGLTFIQGQLFWSDWEMKAILGVSLSNVSNVKVIFGDLSLNPMGLTAACIEKQNNISNLCDGKCKDLCLLSSSDPRGYSCNCCDTKTQPPTLDADVCDHSCGENGRCTGRNYCTCNDGWRGVSCDQGVCTNPCVHGTCGAPNTCLCDDGWQGQNCDQGICCTPCGTQGTCTSPDQCTCDDGWGGDQCETQLCFVDGGCSNDGTCKGDHCDCPKPYGGKRCDKHCHIQTC